MKSTEKDDTSMENNNEAFVMDVKEALESITANKEKENNSIDALFSHQIKRYKLNNSRLETLVETNRSDSMLNKK